jgi:hypothetical protein
VEVTDQERLVAHVLAAYDEDPDATMAAITAASSSASRLVELEARAEVAEAAMAKGRAARAEQIKIAARFDMAAFVSCVVLALLHWLMPDATNWAAISLGLTGMLIGHADGRRTAIKRLPA